MLSDLLSIHHPRSKSVATPAFNRIVKFCTFVNMNP